MQQKKVDLLIHNAGQVVTCASPDGPKRGLELLDVGMIEQGAVAVDDGKIIAVGKSAEIQDNFMGKESIDAGGRVVCPGFVDPHTHVVYAGDRIDEFEMRIKGTSYMEIMAAGGGIMSTTRAVRAASIDQLVAESRPRLDAMLHLGTTTAEVKSGYGLDTESELKMLKAIEALDQSHPMRLIPTFLGAHAVPQEYKDRTEAYVELVIEEMLPTVQAWYQRSSFYTSGTPLFCDVFCENNAFDLEQSRRILAAGSGLGMIPKIHADEFTNLGGVALAASLGAASVDHLDVTPSEAFAVLAQSNTVGVVLPAVNFNLGSDHFADARGLIDAGAAIALSTDINPGSAPCPSMTLVMAIATRYQNILPAEALNACTINAAHAVGLGDKIGSIEPGKEADLTIINSQDYRHLAYQFGENLIGTVIKAGQRITKSDD
ncbi:MAG: imidazolonepropionase [Chloroflexota bacterium]